MNKTQKTAAMIAIADELLSGRTRDANVYHTAQWLTERGIDLREVRVVPDCQSSIVGAVNALRASYDYVFTSGGIGPTHDDITADAIVAAFKTGISERQDAVDILKAWYESKGEELTPARRRMTRIPDGAILIDNPVSGAPGFQLGNVFVMAGVPQIFRSMLDNIEHCLECGPAKVSCTVRGPAVESLIAADLKQLQEQYDQVSIGSYPGKVAKGASLDVVIRGIGETLVREVAAQVQQIMSNKGVVTELIDTEEQ